MPFTRSSLRRHFRNGDLRTLYLAGPDVFHVEAVAIGETKKARCAAHGFVGLYPCDGGGPDDPAATIFARCLAMMREADAGVFDLTPFRGPSADVGTAFELGFMAAMEKPVFAYTNRSADLLDRLRSGGLVRDGATWRDADGMAVEDFGHADNLMLDRALAAQGRRIHRREVFERSSHPDLAGFESCLAEAREFFAGDR